MTDAERQSLNKRIALKRGWWHSKDGLWYAEHENIILAHPPNFTGKWGHAGPLLVELFKDDPELALDEILLAQEQDECDLIEAIAAVYDTWGKAK